MELVHGVLVIYLQKNVVISGVDNSVSRHSENRK